MRIIILGCGYLGTALAHVCLRQGRSVAALTRNPAQAARLRALGVEPVVCADLAGDAWHGALDPSDATVVNCVSPAKASPEGYRQSFIAGTESLRDWLEKSAKAGRESACDLIFTSATSVYPQSDGKWVEENSAFNAAELSAAGAILRESENLLLDISKQHCKRVWILRLAGLYGPGRHQLLDQLREGKLSFASDAENWLNLIHRDDAVAAMMACLDSPATLPGGIFNVADGEPVKKIAVMRWLAQRVGIEPVVLKLDATRASRSPHRQGRSGVPANRRISNRLLKEQLGWNPRHPTFREGYEAILAGEK